MSNLSLQEQLLKSGLSNKTKVKQINAEKRKQTKKQRKNKIEVLDETKQLVEENRAKQLEKDKALNQQRNEIAEKKQIANQILQLIALNKCPKGDESIAYNFTDVGKVKVIYIDEAIRHGIIVGKLAIVKAKKNYEVVPAKVAEKIQQRDEEIIMVLFTDALENSEEDDYQAYEIPDDLMW